MVVLPPSRGTSIFHESQLLSLHGVVKQSFVKLVVIVDSSLTGSRLGECGLGETIRIIPLEFYGLNRIAD